MGKFLVFSILVLCTSSWADDVFEYEDCGASDKTIFFESLDVSPLPVPFPGVVKTSGRIMVTDTIPDNAIVDLKLTRIIKFITDIPIPLPCISGFGSCKYDLCKLMLGNKERICGYFPEGVPCECPILPNTYEGEDEPMSLPDVGSFLSMLAAGRYKVEGRIRDVNTDKELGCIKLKATLTSSGFR
ncbi:ganglioside GM2 activator-like [Limulus polyphemus]|uniref:Ganglioside GM2 activator-like n=1 Tax=Limulus polyphemus TaxID=6850 RepID=A0ABM1SBE6_LIMPO|nr:ganglioside GM2 activator-like [Limulus polyphemus]